MPFRRQFWEAVELARANGSLDDPRIRQKFAWAFTQVEIMRFHGLSALRDALDVQRLLELADGLGLLALLGVNRAAVVEGDRIARFEA